MSQEVLSNLWKQDPKTDMAEKLRESFASWYGSPGLVVPKPVVSNDEFLQREQQDQALLYRPPSSIVSYDAFMERYSSRGRSWTVTGVGSEEQAANRAKIVWEPTEKGYWFWAEIAPTCPRLGTSLEDLTTQTHLLCVEEWVIVERALLLMVFMKRIPVEVESYTWLRTRFGKSGALIAGSILAPSKIHYVESPSQAESKDRIGGRGSEVLES